jgi:GWxTD domain-containing protein
MLRRADGTPRSFGIVLAALLLAAPLPTPAKKSKTLKEWADGPIRYIAEKQEMQLFKELKKDADRALFIERFWARRDPSPETLGNEYRQIFWERVQEANRLFLDSPKVGSLTDRGKIYILYGPPSRIEDLPLLDTHSGPTAGRGLIRWYYEGRPEGRMDMNPTVIVPFVRETTGEYRVSYDPKLSSVFFDALAVEEEWDRAMDRFLEFMGAPRETELSVMLDLGRMQEVPPQSQVLLERVETVETYATLPIDVDVTRYHHPEKAAMVAVVTADVSHVEAGTAAAVIARCRARDARQPQRMLGEDAFKTATVGGRRVAQGRIVLQPGEYDVTVLVADTATAATGLHRGSFTIPERSDRLRMSDTVWATELGPLAYAAMASYDEAYHVGAFHVVPSALLRDLRGRTALPGDLPGRGAGARRLLGAAGLPRRHQPVDRGRRLGSADLAEVAARRLPRARRRRGRGRQAGLQPDPVRAVGSRRRACRSYS